MLPSTPLVSNEGEIDTCVEEMSSAILEALAVSTPDCRTRDEPRPAIPVHIQDEIRLKTRLRGQWQISSDPALKAEVNRLERSVTHQLNKWRNDQWMGTLESLDPEDQSLWKMTKRVMRIPTPSSPLVTPGGTALSDSEKAEALADNLESHFQPLNDPSDPAVIEKVAEALQAYYYALASEPHLTNPMEVQDAILGLKVGEAPGPNGLPNRPLKHIPQRAISLLVAILAALLAQYFPPVLKHARVISILKPGKDPSLPSPYQPISLLDTIGKLFEKILISRILSEVSGRGLLGDEQFGFRPKHTTTLQLARLVERVSRNFGEKRLTGAIYLDVAKTFDTVWVDGLLLKLTALNFPTYLVKILSSYLHNRTFEVAVVTASSTRRHIRAGVAQGGLVSPALFSLYVNDMPVPSRHIELAVYSDDTAITATSRKSALPIRYLETYLSDLEPWLREWRIAINVPSSNSMLFAKAAWRIPRPRPVQFLGQPIEWVDTAHYLGVTLDSRLTSSHRTSQEESLPATGCA
jgi:hypothetical protein